jgi:hypothetical protein
VTWDKVFFFGAWYATFGQASKRDFQPTAAAL